MWEQGVKSYCPSGPVLTKSPENPAALKWVSDKNQGNPVIIFSDSKKQPKE